MSIDPLIRGPIDPHAIFVIRWVAVAGQLAALLFTYSILKFELPLLPAVAVISSSAIVNLWHIHAAQRRRLYQQANFLELGFDVIQIAALLYLTGGLLNPFSILILAPVVVSAAVLRQKSTLLLIGLVAVSVSFLALSYHPLDWGQPVDFPVLYLAGLWLALIISSCFIGGYTWWVASSARRISSALADAKLALVEEQQSRAIGALATSAAHKLGSPLNTITVIAHELSHDITPDHPIYEDITLLSAEIERCRVILSEIDSHTSLKSLETESPESIITLIEEIIYSRLLPTQTNFKLVYNRGKSIPVVRRRPELVHALENLLQNADEFSAHDVMVNIEWSAIDLHISITDDGPGYTRATLARAGQPWNSTRAGQEEHRGLGLFIARSLLESIGGSITFANDHLGGGKVGIILPRESIS